MKTSTLTLYYKSLLNKDKNFILDNPSNGKSAVENYLNTLEKEVITGFQYIKQQLILTIKLNKNQSLLNMGANSQDLNYIKIQNEGETPKYYFIVNKTWKAEETLELTLNMDTLNSFVFNVDYEINKRTLVKREHKDRLKTTGYIEKVFDWDVDADHYVSPTYSTMIVAISEFRDYTITIMDGTTITALLPNFIGLEENNIDGVHVFRFRILTTHTAGHVQVKFKFRCWAFERDIDMRSEEINAPVYKFRDEILYEKDGQSSADWFLYYKNQDDQDNSPVECYLVSDESYDIVTQTADGKVDYSDLPNSGYVMFESATGLSIKFGGASYYLRKSTGWSWGQYENYTLLALQKNGTNVDVWTAKLERKDVFFPASVVFTGKWTKVGTYAYAEIITTEETITAQQVTSLPTSQQFFMKSYSYTDYTINFSAPTTKPAQTLQDIDRTLAENIKIIALPYSPTNFEIDSNGAYVVGDMWKTDIDTGAVKLDNFDARFTNDIRSQAVNPSINMLVPYDGSLDLKNISRRFKDSKLFHSDFFRPKFVYDSFSRTFPLEKIIFSTRDSYLFPFHFTMSRNIVSKFLFSFDYEYKMTTEDFEKIVAVSRNNEQVLYNSAYLNYIRTGYNYDLKSKEKQEVAGGIGIGLSVASIVGSVLVAVATENPVPIAGAVAGGISLVSQITSYAKTTAQAEDNIQRKLQETQQQAVSVMNADDVDLLYEYCQNKAKLCSYKVSEQMETILDDLFYYGGYISNVQKIPNVRTRYWFNYLQASLIIEETNNLTEEIENDIKAKFENGVTFMHNRQNTFDLRQEKENMETSIVGG